MDVVSFSGQLLHEEQIVVNPFAFKVLLISSWRQCVEELGNGILIYAHQFDEGLTMTKYYNTTLKEFIHPVYYSNTQRRHNYY
jgi:hypothetical protein